MLRVIFVITIILTAIGSIAQETKNCSCQRDFEDFIGNVSSVTIHVTCPPYAEESELRCDSEITNSAFTAACTNTVSEKQNMTSISLDPMTDPMYGYTFCQLR